MKILVACEHSGTVRDAFIAKGHDAMSCDFLPTDKPGPHYQGDVRDILGDGWDLMIAHPDCTFLCSSGLHWNKRVDGRDKKTAEALDFVRLLMNASIPKIAIENPVGCIGTKIRKADQYIQPYMFGHDASKKTGLWLKGLPLLKPTKYVEGRLVCCGLTLSAIAGKYSCPNCGGDKVAKRRWGNQTNSGQNKLGPSEDRWKERAQTYQGWAEAMADQWG